MTAPETLPNLSSTANPPSNAAQADGEQEDDDNIVRGGDSQPATTDSTESGNPSPAPRKRRG